MWYGLVAFGVACGSAPKSESVTPATPALTSHSEAAPEQPEHEDEKTPAERWAEKRSREEADATPTSTAALDPLSTSDATEKGPTIEMTPAREIRRKTKGDLEQALKLAEGASNVTEETNRLVARLGKPNWTEGGSRRVWVAREGAQCHRLVFEMGGALEIETVSSTESRMLSGVSRQNACTGKVERVDGVNKTP